MLRIGLACFLFFLSPCWALADEFDQGMEALKNNDFNTAIACFNAIL